MAIDTKDLISQIQAAKLIGTSRVTVWRWVGSGRLKGYPVAGHVLVSRREVERLAKDRGGKR